MFGELLVTFMGMIFTSLIISLFLVGVMAFLWSHTQTLIEEIDG